MKADQPPRSVGPDTRPHSKPGIGAHGIGAKGKRAPAISATAIETAPALGPTSQYFQCETDTVIERIDAIEPDAYARTRNDLDGAATWLGPFLAHGITTTAEVATRVRRKHATDVCYRLFFELAWREFFHRTWERQGEKIYNDLRTPPTAPTTRQRNARLPQAVLDGDTGIEVIDAALAHLLGQGVMHNHARLWTAAIVCNFGQTDWRPAARWFHYQLLDGDLASNTLSWQWVAGTFSNKRYVANQSNINRFSGTLQEGSWLDVPYEAFDDFPLPDKLIPRADAVIPATLRGEPLTSRSVSTGTVALRSIWNLDPRWRPDIDEHIVFVDTDWLAAWPLADIRWLFIEHWSNRSGASLVYGTLDELCETAKTTPFVRQEYPACDAWPGVIEARSWLYPDPEKPFPSFTRFWKQVSPSVGL